MLADQVRQRVLGRLPDAQVRVEGEGCNFSLTVHCEDFRPLSRLQRQKLLYGLFADEIRSGAIHALTVRAELPSAPAAQPPAVQPPNDPSSVTH